MTGLDIRWSAIFADVPYESFDHAAAFWAAVTGTRTGSPVGQHLEHLPLEPDAGDRYVWLQRVGGDVPAWHLDLYVPDLEPAVALAANLGAATRGTGEWWVTCTSPAGLPFCLVREYRGTRRRPAAARWPGGRSELDQICLDIPAPAFAAEALFWSEVTGWPLVRDGEFDRLDVSTELPVGVLLQQLGDDDADGIRAHADLSADDRAAEVARHVGLGARVAEETRHWTVLTDVARATYCITDRTPHSRPAESEPA